MLSAETRRGTWAGADVPKRCRLDGSTRIPKRRCKSLISRESGVWWCSAAARPAMAGRMPIPVHRQMQADIGIQECIGMKFPRRLTRQESQERTRMRLIEAAETLFVRNGFDDTSVDEISEMAGYSRGAFYSNFQDKDQILLAIIDRRWPSVPKALDDILQQTSAPILRAAAVRDWYSNQWRLKDFIALQVEFTRRAMKDCSIRK